MLCLYSDFLQIQTQLENSGGNELDIPSVGELVKEFNVKPDVAFLINRYRLKYLSMNMIEVKPEEEKKAEVKLEAETGDHATAMAVDNGQVKGSETTSTMTSVDGGEKTEEGTKQKNDGSKQKEDGLKTKEDTERNGVEKQKHTFDIGAVREMLPVGVWEVSFFSEIPSDKAHNGASGDVRHIFFDLLFRAFVLS